MRNQMQAMPVHRVMRLSDRRRGRGQGALLELVLAVGIVSFALIGLSAYETNFAQTAKAFGVADYLSSLTNGALAYMNTNAPALETALSDSGGAPIVISLGPTSAGGTTPTEPSGLPTPISGGFLPASFVATDGYDHTVELLVKQNPNNTSMLSGLIVTTGGTLVPDNMDGKLADRIGVAGGFYPKDAALYPIHNAVVGAFGGWSAIASAWGGIPVAGHPAVTLDYGVAQNGLSNYLARYNLGVPEPNTMHTDVYMGQNNISNANTVDTGELTDINGTSTVAAGKIVVGAVDSTHAVTQNMNLDVSGALSDDTQVQFYNAAPLVWAPSGTNIPNEVALQILSNNGTGTVGGGTVGLTANPYLALEGPLGLYISGETYANGVVFGNNGIYDTAGTYSAASPLGNGIGQFGVDNNISEVMTANGGIFSLDEPTYDAATGGVGGPGLHVFGNPGGTPNAGINYEWDDLGKSGLTMESNAGGTGNSANITLFNAAGYDGGNINLVNGGNVQADSGTISTGTGNVETGTGNIESGSGYIQTGYRATMGAACPIAGAMAQNSAGTGLLYCNNTATWSTP
jgi:hypothetical protein